MAPLTEENPRHERYRLMGIVIWVSFVAACLATTLFFATFDPLDIIDKTTFPLNWSRPECYTAAFFLFWALTAGTGSVVAWLAATPPPASVAEMRQR